MPTAPPPLAETPTERIRRAKQEIVAADKAKWRHAARKSSEAISENQWNGAFRYCCSDYWIRTSINGAEVRDGGRIERDRTVYPSTPCHCEQCKGLRDWPNNRYVSSRGIAFDCSLQKASLDPEFREIADELQPGSATILDLRAATAAARRGRIRQSDSGQAVTNEDISNGVENVPSRPILCRDNLKRLPVTLSGADVEIIGWHIEGREYGEVAKWLGVDRSAVTHRLGRLRKLFRTHGIKFPSRPEQTSSRHVRNIDPKLARSL